MLLAHSQHYMNERMILAINKMTEEGRTLYELLQISSHPHVVCENSDISGCIQYNDQQPDSLECETEIYKPCEIYSVFSKVID